MSTPEDKKAKRLFGLTTFSVDNATTVFLLTLIIVLFGVRSYQGMPKESFPEIAWPTIYINTVYFGNSAADIENLVTRPIEKELAEISELKTVSSSSLQDYSLITAEFNPDVEMDDAVRKVKDAVDRAKQDLPTDLTTEPEVLEINLSEIPILTVNLSGSYSNEELKGYAEYLEDKIEDLAEISSVDIKGIQDKEISIAVDIPKMQARQVSFGDIENAIRSENLTMSGGELIANEFRRNIRVIGEFEDAEELSNLIIKSENQFPVYLREIAEVKFDFAETTSIARDNGFPVVSLDVIKKKGENLLIASDRIKEIIAEAKADILPENLSISVFNDQSVQTRNMVSNLENSIISGVVLVVLVLLFFLGIRNSLFVGMAIPLSMLIGFILIQAIGYTMNMVVLFSLILALGMLVDNGIVVIENIYRYMQEGYSRIDAAKYGTGEVAVPIITSTLTTLAAFLPLAFWPGLMGEFMQYLPITLIITLSSSLFVALVINPVFAARFMKLDEKITDVHIRRRKVRNNLIGVGVLVLASLAFHVAGTEWLRNALWIVSFITLLNVFVLRPASFWFQATVLPWLERTYDHFIAFSLRGRMPIFLFIGTFVLLFFSLFLLGIRSPDVKFFPEADPTFVNAFVELPVGKDITATDRLMREIEEKVINIVEPHSQIVESVLSQIGENTADPSGPPEFGASPHRARLTVSFVPFEKRGGVSTQKILEEIRAGLDGYAGVQIVVQKNSDGPPTGKPINLEIQGKDIDKLALLSDEVLAYLKSKNIAGIEELKKSVSIGKPELLVNIDREAARRYEVSTYAIADAIRTSVFGKEVSKYKVGEDEYSIQLRVKDVQRYNMDDVLNQSITFRNPANGQIAQVPISAVADVTYSSSYTAINRKDQERVITLYSNVLGGYNANEVVNKVKAAMSEYNMPGGFSYKFTGEQQEQAENMEFLNTAFLIALFMIFLIIVAQFNSLISPVIIMFSVLFSTIGVFLGYVVNDMDIEIVMTGVGIISLAGVVVNNAIVLIDFTQLSIKRRVEEKGLDNMFQLPKEDVRKALEEAGATRLRPVLLTAITTVLGLVPLATGFNFNFFTLVSDLDPQIYSGGDNAAFWGTLSWTVIYGLMFATFLTLVVVPVMFWLAYRFNGLVRRLISN